VMKLLISYIVFTFLLFSELNAKENQSYIKNINSYEAVFTQSIINSSGKEILYNGKIYIKQPSQMLWKYNDPIEKFVHINNKNVTIIEPDLEQAIMSRLEKEINIIKLLKDSTKVDETTYKSTLYDKVYTIKIINNKLTQIKYTDELDNNITIDFKNIKQNEPIPSDIFKFKIPYDFDIIKK
ncbi:MAG: LolA-like outer membrane lipoprotein chaperone, partial [Campylobacterota bacterium]|nr:LolA-like outer membrane lipoprotein chaperone [Campylobacterota bacterium]